MQRIESSVGRVAWLREEHQVLKRRVAELDRRSILTPDEQRLVVELKKRKLATKDAIMGLSQD
jgi:hypothetical protein